MIEETLSRLDCHNRYRNIKSKVFLYPRILRTCIVRGIFDKELGLLWVGVGGV